MQVLAKAARAAGLLLLSAFSATASAQVQRTFVNLGFELPSAGSSNCFFQVDESTVPGWTTNHPSQSGQGCAPQIAAGSGKLIEIWANGFNGVSPRSGTQLAELNAEAASRIYQNVCLANGEPIGWRFSHRGRQSATVDDVAEFRVGSTPGSNQVIRAATQNDGGFTAPTCFNTASSSTGISSNSCAAPALSGTWRDYSGEFTWNGATGVQAIGFEAISAAGGATVGNFIDDIQVTLRPFVELNTATLNVREGSNASLPALRVVGTVPAGGISVNLEVQAAGTATRGSDYTTAGSTDSVTVSVPAGVYDGDDFPLPIALVDDAAIENNETLVIAIVSSPTNYVLSSTQTCGGTPILSSTITLLDNEVDLSTNLTAPAASANGSTASLSVGFANHTAAPTTGDATAHDATAAVALAQPSGLSFTSWTCTASNGARCPGGAVNASTSGSGAIGGNALLPAGNAAAGGAISYSIQASVSAAYCSSVTLAASIATPAPLAEGSSVQSGFTSPAPAGTANNSAGATIAVPCANQPPVFASTPATQATRGELYRYDAQASDPDVADVLAFNLDTAPAGMTVDPASGRIEWTPADDQVGTHAVAVRVSDGRGGQAVQEFTITVIAVNRPPRIGSMPVVVGTTGQAYAYDVNATDPDNDTIAYRLVQSPAGMTIDPASGLIAWTPTDTQLAAADVTVQATDTHGASDDQVFRIIVNATLIGHSHLGTEFWFTDNMNFYVLCPPRHDHCIAASDTETRSLWVTVAALDGAQGYVEIPGLSFRQDFTLAAGGIAEFRLPWQAMNFFHTTIVDKGVHVVSDRPVTVVSTNRSKASTDSALIYPVDVLGTQYTVIDYPTFDGYGGEFGVVAIQDNTRVTFMPPANTALLMPPGVPQGSSWSVTLQRGQAYMMAMNANEVARYQPYSGMRVMASAPIAVFGGSICSDAPTAATFCDHLYEQLLPDRNLGQHFMAGTLATRSAGNLYRFVAPEADTAVYAGNRLIAVLGAGEAVDRTLAGPVDIRSSKPVHSWLIAQSESVDSGQRQVPPDADTSGGKDADGDLLDPFAIALPPVGTELSEYLFTTPAISGIRLHYADIVIDASATATLTLDGQAAAGVTWQAFPGSDKVHGNLRLSAGRHRLKATAPFALTVYGYGVMESYGYSGGLLIGDQDRVRRLEVSPAQQTRTVGDSACFSVVARDELQHRVPYARFAVRVGGASPRFEARYFDGTGLGEYCFDQAFVGTVPVQFSSGQAQMETQVTWLAPSDGINRAPVITSLPALELHDAPFHYDVDAIDPNGDTLSYVLVDGPAGAQIDAQTGQLSWTAIAPADRHAQVHGFTVRAVDSQGLYAEQIFDLRISFAARLLPLNAQEADDRAMFKPTAKIVGDAAENLRADLIDSPPGMKATLDWSKSEVALDWPAASPALRHSPQLQLGTYDGRFDAAGFATRTAWHVYSGGIEVPVFGRPLDTNADGVVNASDRLVAAGLSSSGAKLAARFVDTGEALPWSGTPTTCPSVVPAFVDLNGDGKDELVYCSTIGTVRKLTAINGANQRFWTTEPDFGIAGFENLISSIETADLDGDGSAEIVGGGGVYGANGVLRWSFGPAAGEIAATHGHPLISDLDNDGSPEVMLVDQVRRANGSLWWRLPADGTSGALIGDFAAYDIDGDGDKEVFVRSANSGNTVRRLERLNSDGTRLGPPRALNSPGGTPRLFDIDRDGSVEIYLPWERLAVAADGSERQANTPYNFAAAVNDVLMADVNRDGAMEFFGISGKNFALMDLSSGWQWHKGSEIISTMDSRGVGALVDSNGDGNAELFLGGVTNTLEKPELGIWPIDRAGRRSLRDGEGRFAGSFGVDIPPAAAPSGLHFDAWIGDLFLRPSTSGQAQFDVVVRNRGLKPMTAPAQVSLYAGPPASGGELLATTTTAALHSNQQRLVSFGPVPREKARGWIYARIEPAETTPDVRADNNVVAAHMIELALSDGADRIDTQSSSVQVLAKPKTFSLSGNLPARIYSGHEITLQIQGGAIDYDGTPYFTLTGAPQGVRINPWSGVLSWTPTAAQAGYRSFYVNVTFFDGSTTFTTLSTEVVANPNRPPNITSTAPTQALTGTLFHYAVAATDPDNDVLSYALTTKPAGMSIDPASGDIQWTPTSGQVGTHAVVLRVTDSGSNVATQNFSVVVQPPIYAPPTFTTVPPQWAKVGCPYSYAAHADPANGGTVNYNLEIKPANMSIVAATGLVQWTPAASQVGSHVVEVKAGILGSSTYSYQRYTLRLAGANEPLLVDIQVEPAFAAQGEPVTVTAQVLNPGGNYTLGVNVDGAPVSLDAQGRYIFTPAGIGAHPITASVADGCQTAQASATAHVTDPSDTEAPVVQLLSPADNAVVTKPSAVIGTVTDAHLASWRLALKDEQGGAAFRVLASGSNTFSNVEFAKLDPTLLLNGLHILVLEATDTSGRVSFDSVAVSVEGDMKVGHYSITFLDVEIPLSGIPIRVTRTYDTRRAHEDLDFGHGWSIDYQNVRVRENRKLGFSWRLAQQGGGLSPWCVRPLSDPLVTVTLPDGKVEKFKARFEPECQQFTPQVNGQMVFDPVGNTHGKLEQLSFGLLRVVELGDGSSNVADPDELNVPADPQLYRLTTAEGLVYEIDQGFGIKTITDQAGNTITYDRSGIRHSNGRAIGFVRDANDRIERITLPDGEERRYDYSAAGDLSRATDAAGVFVDYAYLPEARWPHYLNRITDAIPHPIARHEYDAQGRLVATTDANNQRIEYTHNLSGQVEVIKNRRGHSTTYIYDDNGWVLSETNALNEQTLHSYDANGNELTTTDPLGRVTTRSYDVRGNLLTETNHAGETVTRTYGYFNQLKTETDALGRVVLSNDYWINQGQETGILIRSTDGLGNTTHYGMDVCSGLTCSNTGNLKSLTDANGNIRRFDYDRYGNLIQETDTQGNATVRQYDAMGRVLRETRQRRINGEVEEAITQHVYTPSGELLQSTSPDGIVTVREYLPNGQVKHETVDTIKTDYGYTNDGRVTTTTSGPLSLKEETLYDPEGNVIGTIDALLNKTTMVYDAANRLVETIHPHPTTDNPRTRQEYYKDGQLKYSWDERNNRTQYLYDDAGRQVSVINALNEAMSSIYDDNGRRIASVDNLDRTTKYQYDIAGRLTRTILPDAGADDGNDANNLTVDYAYDKIGRKVAETDPANRTTRFVYDAEGRLIAVVLPNPTTGDNPIGIADALGRGEYPGTTIASSGVLVTRYAYDEQGNKTQQIDALNRTTRWTYDKVGHLTQRTLPLGQFERFNYDASGKLDWKLDFNGQLTTFGYDTSNRLVSTRYADGKELSLTLDNKSRPLTLTYGGLTETRRYDVRDRLDQVKWSDGQQIDYSYDKASNRTSVVTGTRTLNFSFDVLNRLSTVSEVASTALGQSGSPRTTTYGYDGVGNRDHIVHANGTRVDYRYDRMNRLTTLTHRKGAAVLLALGYALNPDGTRAAIAEQVQQRDTQGQYVVDGNGEPVLDATRTTSYQYDQTKRLIEEAVTATNADHQRTTSWVYDKVGNRLSQAHTVPGGTTVPASATTTSYSYDSNDRLLQESAVNNGVTRLTTHRYDLNGSLTETATPEQTMYYRYNSQNRMVQAERKIGSVLDITQYSYTADGIRRSQVLKAGTVDAREIRYLIDPNQAYAQVIEERVGTPLAPGANVSGLALKTAYTYGDDLLGQYALRDASGNTLPGAATAAIPSTFHYDGLGSTRLLTDSAGNPIDSYAYGAFGEVDQVASALITQDTPATDYQYAGEQRDPNLDWYYLRARYMNFRNGRFTAADSFAGRTSDPVSLNKYLYANANPAIFTDPSGYTSLHEISFSNSLLSTLQSAARIGSFAVNTYDKIDKMITLLQMGQGAANAFEMMRQFSLQQGGVSETGFIDAIKDLDEAAIVLSRNFTWVLGEMTTPKKERQIREFISNPKNKLLIYGPTPYLRTTPWLPPGTRISAGSVKMSKSSRSIEVELGRASGQGGRVMGIGHSYGSAKNQGSQWWRMDWHSLLGHGPGSNDRVVGAYHFHTQTAP